MDVGHGMGGSLYVTPALATLSVHFVPSQYRYSYRREGSGYQSAGTAGFVVGVAVVDCDVADAQPVADSESAVEGADEGTADLGRDR